MDLRVIEKIQTNLGVAHDLNRDSKVSQRSFFFTSALVRHILRTHFILSIILLIFTKSCSGFNLDEKFPTIASIPEADTYFGFSVGLNSGESESWLLVGAPKSNITGEVYKCKYETGALTSNCSVISIERDPTAAPNVKEMFGITMLTGPKGRELLACAPYFTDLTQKASSSLTTTFYDMVGVCYFVNDFTAPSRNAFKLMPCAADKGRYHDGDAYGQCELGLSAAFTKDGNNLILGAPRAFYQGSLMVISLPIKNDIERLPLHTGEVNPKIPPGWQKDQYLIQSYDENYLGYASATGRTINDMELLFVGAPARFRYNLYGMVMVYDQQINSIILNFTGDQTGEYFGCAIASTDLNGDGLDDVIIGAPQYSDPEKSIYESGRIFIYYQTGGKTNLKGFLEYVNFTEPIVVKGTTKRAMFGYSISAIGDINQDGYQDIAVGAPYSVNGDDPKHNDGSVFIFNGGSEGLQIPASQEIKGISITESVRGFGQSISGNADMDKNLYPDIIAGAYLSGHAVMIRSRPVVEITSDISVNPKVVDIENPSCDLKDVTTSCFKIKTCFVYTGKSVPDSLQLSYTYDIDSTKDADNKRAFILDEKPRNITLVRESVRASKRKCIKEYGYVKLDMRDKLSDIVIKVSYSLIAKDEPVQPVLDDFKPMQAITKVKIYRDCGEDDICQADLRVVSKLDTTQLYAGRSWPLLLEQNVMNKGEPAFLSTLVVEVPDYVNYVGTQKEGSSPGITQLCSSLGKFVTCEVGNPLKRDAKVTVNLKFRTLQLDGNVTSLAIKSFVNTTNPTNNTSEVVTSAMQIGVKSDISIYNISSPEGFYFKTGDKEKYQKNVTTVRHIYQIVNKGPSDVSKATIRLTWPLRTNEGLGLLELEEIVENKYISCNATQMNVKHPTKKNATDDGNRYYCDGRASCATTVCSVSEVFEQLQIVGVFRLPFATVLQNDYDSFIRSELSFTIDEYPYPISTGGGPTISGTVTTESRYQRTPESKEVAWWIILIAIVAGVLCLLIMIFILWKCGFFERKKRPDSDEDRMQKQALNPKSGVEEDEEEMKQYLDE